MHSSASAILFVKGFYFLHRILRDDACVINLAAIISALGNNLLKIQYCFD